MPKDAPFENLTAQPNAGIFTAGFTLSEADFSSSSSKASTSGWNCKSCGRAFRSLAACDSHKKNCKKPAYYLSKLRDAQLEVEAKARKEEAKEETPKEEAKVDAVYKDKIMALYQQYNPSKPACEVYTLLAKYAGTERDLYLRILEKWKLSEGKDGSISKEKE